MAGRARRRARADVRADEVLIREAALNSVRALLLAALRSLRRRLPQLVGFELVVKLIAWAIIVPLTTWLTARLIATTGHLAVANVEIAQFLLRPAGILTVLVVIVAELAARVSYLAGPMLIDASARRGETMTTFGALVRVGIRLRRLVWIGLLIVGRFLLVAGPLAAIATFVAMRLLSERDIYYYLTVRPPEFWTAVAVAGVLGTVIAIVGVAMLARWIFAVPVFLFEGLGGRAALARSRELSRGSFWRLAAVIVAWVVIAGATAWVLTFVATRLGELMVATLGHNIRLLIPAFGLLIATNVVLFFGLDVAGSLVVALLVYHLFLDRKIAEGSEVAIASSEQSESVVRQLARAPAWARWGAVAAVVAGAVAITGILSEQVDLEDDVAITAHRGSSLRAPENTLAAIELAIVEGADYAEIDVQETADGVVVLLHDRDLKRVTGLTRNIWDVTYAEIRDLDAGSWFSEDFAGERIPTLQEAIDLARGRIKLNIELKYNEREEALSQRTVELIRRNGAGPEVVITSLSYRGLREVAALDSSLSLGFIVARSMGNPWGLGVDFLSVETRLFGTSTAARAHAAGKLVHVWSVKDPDRMSRLIDLGVDNIITDDPLVARKVLEERAQLGDVERLGLFIRSRFGS